MRVGVLTIDLGLLLAVDLLLNCVAGSGISLVQAPLAPAEHAHFSQSLQEWQRVSDSADGRDSEGDARFGRHRAQRTWYGWGEGGGSWGAVRKLREVAKGRVG